MNIKEYFDKNPNTLTGMSLGIINLIFFLIAHSDFFAYSSNLFLAASLICNAIESK